MSIYVTLLACEKNHACPLKHFLTMKSPLITAVIINNWLYINLLKDQK